MTSNRAENYLDAAEQSVHLVRGVCSILAAVQLREGLHRHLDQTVRVELQLRVYIHHTADIVVGERIAITVKSTRQH